MLLRDPGAIRESPDPKRLRDRRSWIENNPGVRARAQRRLLVPADVPEGAAAVPLNAVWGPLQTLDAEVAQVVLDEASAAFREPYDRIESAERRATTLQGSVAIAASATVAGAGLLLDRGSVQDTIWRIVLATTLVAVVGALLACGIRAVGVTGRIFQFEEPGGERRHIRADLPVHHAKTLRAAELLRAAAVADMIASVKVGLLRSAVWWFRTALVLLGLLALMVLVLVATNDSESPINAKRAPAQSAPRVDPTSPRPPPRALPSATASP